ncbi:concanavalin A-like motif protein [Ranid herpesvirus 3]|uniref:Concanavalin A-like motif protein n=1 Tax=Ranid herpesvirus 3 TaxID=1987509 RepID=A0A1X9T5B6_9VIRU|nr:concanavalin A-like motif protein [Ranid herpesvirus 3]ARR28894.1 concanavalin A-like motif protein [Ranid herpesvirus 3]
MSSAIISPSQRIRSAYTELGDLYAAGQYDVLYEPNYEFREFMTLKNVPDYEPSKLLDKATHILAVHKRLWNECLTTLKTCYEEWCLNSSSDNCKDVSAIEKWVNAYSYMCSRSHGLDPAVSFTNYVMLSNEGLCYVKKRIREGQNRDLELFHTLTLPYVAPSDIHLVPYFYFKLYGSTAGKYIVEKETQWMNGINVEIKYNRLICVEGATSYSGPSPDRLVTALIYYKALISDSFGSNFLAYGSLIYPYIYGFDMKERVLSEIFTRPFSTIANMFKGPQGQHKIINYPLKDNYAPRILTVPSYILILNLALHPVYFAFVKQMHGGSLLLGGSELVLYNLLKPQTFTS